jgi:hypothetical protein
VIASPAPKPAIVPGGTVTLCAGDSAVLDAGGGFASYRWSTGDSSRTIVARAAGRYSVDVANVAGCRSVAADVVVVVRQAPPAPSIAQSGDTLIATSAAAYQWMRDGVPIAGATAREYRHTGPGRYTVAIRDGDGCAAVSAPYEPGGTSTATIALSDVEAAPGEHFVLPVMLASSANLDGAGAASFSATLRFNATLLMPAGATPMGTLKDGERIIPITGLRTAGSSGGALARLEFVAMLGNADSTPIAIDGFAWDGASVSSTALPGMFRLAGICRNGGTRLVDARGNLALKAVRPNPAGGTVEIEYEVVEEGRTRLAIADLRGHTAALLVDGEIAPGRYVVSFDVSALPSGSYIYTLQTPSARLSRMMVVRR